MKEMPLPLTVSAINTLGLSVIPLSLAKTCSKAAKSCPSQRSTCQPKILEFGFQVPQVNDVFQGFVRLELVYNQQ